jgi:hypothetical protein
VGGTTARLLCLALAAAGLAGLPGTSLPAAAASAQRIAATEPIAIGVNSFGTSYVGFATGGALARFNADGKKLAPLGLDQQGPVTAISVAPDDRVWVYYGTSVSAFEPGGRLHRHFDVAEPGSCAGNAHDPSRYGGLVVTATTVYVASRCTNTLEAYSKFGLRQARVDLPSGGYPRGVAWMAPQGNPKLPARLFVAMPNRGELLTYNAETLRSASRPTARHQVERPDRGSKPEPSGVTADRYGIVAVTDAANHAVNIYNANSGMSRFRVLGHPPRAGKFAGALDRATAMAQHDQDGGGLSGNLFIADTGNGRAQRWDIGGGYTYWAKSVSAPRPGDPGDPGGPGDPDDPDPGDPDDPGGPGGPDDPGGPGGPDDPWIPDPGDPTNPTDPDDPIDPDDPDPGDPGASLRRRRGHHGTDGLVLRRHLAGTADRLRLPLAARRRPAPGRNRLDVRRRRRRPRHRAVVPGHGQQRRGQHGRDQRPGLRRRPGRPRQRHRAGHLRGAPGGADADLQHRHLVGRPDLLVHLAARRGAGRQRPDVRRRLGRLRPFRHLHGDCDDLRGLAVRDQRARRHLLRPLSRGRPACNTSF